MSEKVTDSLVEALRLAMAEPQEQRLFRSGKLAGLFPSRAGTHAEAAKRAIEHGLLEVVRTDTKGKVIVEWVRLTPQGVEFLHEHDSPIESLEELRQLLQTTQAGLPGWLAGMQQELQKLSAGLTQNAERWSTQLDALSIRIEEALRRAEAGMTQVPGGVVPVVAWALQALSYLDHRQRGGQGNECPLSELFAALRESHPDLSIQDFHDGLRRLHDRGALRLWPFTGPAVELPEPEYALMDGPTVFVFASR
jgi:DNA-binding PadR family transcriptional regulator